MDRTKRLQGVSLAACLFGFLIPTAQAHRVSVDFNDSADSPGFAVDGQVFTTANTQFGAPNSGLVPFDLNFGSGALSYDFCFNGNGFVSFVTVGSACATGPTPTGNYIGAFVSSLTNGGNTMSSSGGIDSIDAGTAANPFDFANVTPAMRFIWDGTDSANNSILAEAILLDKGSGNFVVQFAYGSDLFGIDGAPGTGQQVINLGANLLGPVNGPFATATDYSFSFVDGVCSACGTPPTAVSEPGTLALFGIALMPLLLMGRRRLLK